MTSFCIAGLGNPGSKYEPTRHNIGFRFIDYLAWRNNCSLDKNKFNVKYTHYQRDGVRVYLACPQKFMNLSGEALHPLLQFLKVEYDHLIVVHDEIDLPFGEVREKFGGGHRGHNGLRNIMKVSGNADFHRLRCGVDRPAHPDVAGYVLSPFSREEEAQMKDFYIDIERKLDAILDNTAVEH